MTASVLECDPKLRLRVLVIILLPTFVWLGINSAHIRDARKQDFAAYWQAGHMILSGQDVYNSAEWIAERELRGTAFHSEPTFHYPLPFAVLFSPLALLPIQTAYGIWLFFELIALLSSIILLLNFYPNRGRYFELYIVAGVFLFRPAFAVIFNGQILAFILFALSMAIRLFHHRHMFWGGFILGLLALKPNIGVPVLGLAIVWLFMEKNWKGILGVGSGCVILFLLGFAIDANWVLEYLPAGGDALYKYHMSVPTLWGVMGRLFASDQVSFIASIAAVFVVLWIEIYILLYAKYPRQPLEVFASIVPAALLAAPYAWSHDQILLIPSMLYVMISLSVLRGNLRSALFLIGSVTLSISLALLAYTLLHDVWSFLNSLLMWVLVMIFTPRKFEYGKIDGMNVTT